MRRPWIAPGLFAEGPSDYHFLGELLPRVVRNVATGVFGPDFERRDTIVPLDAPWERRRADRVVAALEAVADECTLLFIHADGNGDPERARSERVLPAAERIAAVHPDIVTVACVPVRETEAWLLGDLRAFESVVGRAPRSALPGDAESVLDPKDALRRTLADLGVALPRSAELFARFGQEIDLAALRRLAAFRRMEDDLHAALRRLGERG